MKKHQQSSSLWQRYATSFIGMSWILLGAACSQTPTTSSSGLAGDPGPGRFMIKSVNSGLCLDVPHASTQGGTVLTQFTCNGSNAQIFELRRVQGNAYVIANFNGSMVLDIWGISKDPGAKLQLWNATGGKNQEFQVEDAGYGQVYLKASHSGLVLDVDKVSKDPGAIVLQWNKTGNANQRWTFEPVGKPSPDGWRLVWSDEFNGSEIDGSKWTYDVHGPGWVNHELQNYTNNRRENARVENGHLVIEARKDGFQGHDYSSARLKTQGKASWTYGRIEARIQLPSGVGTWPAFWMMPDNQSRGWPACGEIDIMEHVGYDQDWINATTHSNTYSWRSSTQRTAKTLVPGVTTGYHVYALEWYPDRIDMFVDGKKYYTSPNDNTGDDAYPFNKNFHIILNLAVGGDWGGIKGVDANIWPKQMLVDYVRVYQK